MFLMMVMLTLSSKPAENEIPDKNATVDLNVSDIKNTAQTETVNPIKEVDGFVLLKDMDSDFVIDLRYAGNNNFTKKIVYPYSICVLRKCTAEKLVRATIKFKELGYRIKIWDAYRPVSVQIMFWNLVKDSRYVADPYDGGSIHNKGCAVDITLVDKSSNEIEMPSDFDDFSSKAFRTNQSITETARKNLKLLTDVMTECGFTTIDSEWWHFNDSNSDKYKIEDINLRLFLVQNRNTSICLKAY